jgi:general secretion pathway protein G
VIILGLLAGLVAPKLFGRVGQSKQVAARTQIELLGAALDQYSLDIGSYPASLDALVSDGYMRKVPEDPITKSADTWQTIPAEADPNNPGAEPGIYDIKSGAQGTALDGSSYSDW